MCIYSYNVICALYFILSYIHIYIYMHYIKLCVFIKYWLHFISYYQYVF